MEEEIVTREPDEWYCAACGKLYKLWILFGAPQKMCQDCFHLMMQKN